MPACPHAVLGHPEAALFQVVCAQAPTSPEKDVSAPDEARVQRSPVPSVGQVIATAAVQKMGWSS